MNGSGTAVKEDDPHGIGGTVEKMSIDMGNLSGKAEGQLVDHGADTTLHRSLSTRHLTMISLGSAIGMGMWLGSGTSLSNGGPASLFIGFLISSSMVWFISQSVGEMAVMYPLPSAFVQWSTMFIRPAAGFAPGGDTGFPTGSLLPMNFRYHPQGLFSS